MLFERSGTWKLFENYSLLNPPRITSLNGCTSEHETFDVIHLSYWHVELITQHCTSLRILLDTVFIRSAPIATPLAGLPTIDITSDFRHNFPCSNCSPRMGRTFEASRRRVRHSIKRSFVCRRLSYKLFRLLHLQLATHDMSRTILKSHVTTFQAPMKHLNYRTINLDRYRRKCLSLKQSEIDAQLQFNRQSLDINFAWNYRRKNEVELESLKNFVDVTREAFSRRSRIKNRL